MQVFGGNRTLLTVISILTAAFLATAAHAAFVPDEDHPWNDPNEGCCIDKTSSCPLVGATGGPAGVKDETFAICPASMSNDACRANQSWSLVVAAGSGMKAVKFFKYDRAGAQQMLAAEVDKAKTELGGNLKDAFKADYIAMMDSLKASLPNQIGAFNDIEENFEGVCAGAIHAIERVRQRIVAAYDFQKRMQDRFDGDLKPSDPPGPNGVAVPDPKLGFSNAKILKRYNGQAVPGSTDIEKTRNFLAESFERLVRIFIAGSDQLARDMPGGPPIQPKLEGLYSGQRPDLLNSSQEKGAVYLTARTKNFSLCNPDVDRNIAGVANPSNRWFKDSSGSYKEEITNTTSGMSLQVRVTNHQCPSQNMSRDDYAPAVRARGQAINNYMRLMEIMKTSIRNGAIPSESALGVGINFCEDKKQKIIAMRSELATQMANLKAGQSGGTFVECANQLEETTDGSLNLAKSVKQTKSGGVAGSAACDIAQMQNLVELNMTLQYAYCVWYAVGSQAEQSIYTEVSNFSEVRHDVWSEKMACRLPDRGTFLNLGGDGV